MKSDARTHGLTQQVLGMLHEAGPAAARLGADAERLAGRLRRFLAMNLISPECDREAMELACYALQLPLRPTARPADRRAGAIGLRERADQAAELLLAAWPESADGTIADRVARLLRELPQREPAMTEAKLLADVVNLDDFGAAGLLIQAMSVGRNEGTLTAVAQGLSKRQQYGYWEARLKDGFHFEPVRQLARQRLEHARRVMDLLLAEMGEDQKP